MKPASVYVLGLLLSLPAAFTVSAQDNPDLDWRTLKGIKGVRVFAAVAKDIGEAGLRTDVIKTDTELKLRQAGIRVLDTDVEFARTPGSPGLAVSVDGLSNRANYGFCVSVALSQSVLLERDPSLRAIGKYRGLSFTAETWNTAITGMEFGNPSDRIRSTIKDLG
jgi:hypothetical protein